MVGEAPAPSVAAEVGPRGRLVGEPPAVAAAGAPWDVVGEMLLAVGDEPPPAVGDERVGGEERAVEGEPPPAVGDDRADGDERAVEDEFPPAVGDERVDGDE